MKYLSIIFLFFFLCLGENSSLTAQRTKCGSQILHEQKLYDDPVYRERYYKLERSISEAMKTGKARANCGSPTFFPVAIHFDWVPSAADQAKLITLAQNQMATLNTAFNSMDCQGTTNSNCFEFFLATHNHPAASGLADGQPAVTFGGTPGVDYCSTGGGLTQPCNLSTWVGYMNITVNDLSAGNNGCTDLGVSHLPGNPTTMNSMSVNSCTFGSIGIVTGVPQVLDNMNSNQCDCLEDAVNGGTTVVHEIGHFLGLFHTFCVDNPSQGANGDAPTGSVTGGDIDGCEQASVCGGGCTTTNCDCDLVADTPPQAFSNIGCPGGSAAGVLANPSDPGNSDAFRNFMDYVDDACMDCFSQGQYSRLAATIASAEAGVANYKTKAQVSGGGSTTGQGEGTCLAGDVVNSNEIPGTAGTYTYRSSTTLSTNGTVAINSGYTVSFLAGTSVTLSAGFEAKAGSTFEAKIEACTPALNQEEAEVLALRNTISPPADGVLHNEREDIRQSTNEIEIYPNPFSDRTLIRYTLASESNVSLIIYNSSGQEVRRLVESEMQSSGSFQYEFRPEQAYNGMFFAILQTDGAISTRRFVFVK